MRPHRTINLNDPYIGMADGSRPSEAGPEQGDYAPMVGEVGVGFFADFSDDLTNAGATAEAHITAPSQTSVVLPCTVRGHRVSFVTGENMFLEAGYYRIILTIDFPGGGVRKIGRTVYVNGA